MAIVTGVSAAWDAGPWEAAVPHAASGARRNIVAGTRPAFISRRSI
jgi:hypothetical protein